MIKVVIKMMNQVCVGKDD